MASPIQVMPAHMRKPEPRQEIGGQAAELHNRLVTRRVYYPCLRCDGGTVI
jgi:hypothetical protein